MRPPRLAADGSISSSFEIGSGGLVWPSSAKHLAEQERMSRRTRPSQHLKHQCGCQNNVFHIRQGPQVYRWLQRVTVTDDVLVICAG